MLDSLFRAPRLLAESVVQDLPGRQLLGGELFVIADEFGDGQMITAKTAMKPVR